MAKRFESASVVLGPIGGRSSALCRFAGHVNVVARLLDALRDVGADEQVTALAERLPAAGHFGLFINHGGHREQFQFGREPDGSAASSWTWNDLD
ncbi:hypothetical protein ABZ192_40790 [Streptomyces sp. NPDC006235]|uniref:hypothetical protein n=1 Tax=Streptomyces sp. NPDC006235 TaxID=3156736 RepID=UPI00339F2A0D